jgi:hypothetical protein
MRRIHKEGMKAESMYLIVQLVSHPCKEVSELSGPGSSPLGGEEGEGV